MTYRFRNFELDPRRSTLTRDGHRVRLEPTPFRLLALLLERAPELVSKEEAIRTLWPAGKVSNGSLARAAREIRRALRERAGQGGTLRTVRGQGYAIDAPVERLAPRGDGEVSGWTRLGEPPSLPGAERGGAAPTDADQAGAGGRHLPRRP